MPENPSGDPCGRLRRPDTPLSGLKPLTGRPESSAGGQFHVDPATYLDEIRADIPRFDELQATTIEAIPFPPERVLELGIGTGETTRRLLERFPDARVTGLDSSAEMAFRARELGIEVRL